MAAAVGAINVRDLIDRRVGPYQIWVMTICFMISLVDGVDSQAPSVTGPMMASDLHLAPGALGPILSASPWGALFGAFLFGVCADRWGRRPILIGCGVLFSCATLATAWSDSFTTLLICRLVTGFGIGGALPSFFAMSVEYAPQRRRAGVVAIIASAVPAGGILVGLLGPSILADFGWRAVYFTSGVASLVICFLAFVQLPESLSFMIIRGKDPARIRRVLLRVAPGSVDPSATKFLANEEARPGVSVKHLFTSGRAPVTILLWVACIINYAVLLGTLVWTPTLMKHAGMSLADGSLAFSFNNVGGIIGVISSGQIVDRLRFSSFPVLAAIALGGAVVTALIGYTAPNLWAVAAFSTLAGLSLATVAIGLYSAAAALIYPTFMRTTGIGWCTGFGRLGSTVGPLLVGAMVAWGWGVPADFQGLALIGAINIVVIGVLGMIVRRRRALLVVDTAVLARA
jgi:AAHS family 4-hydroxybenzoate transporter-like MFS transporter